MSIERFSETDRFAFQNGSFCTMKRPVLQFKTAYSVTPLTVNALQARKVLS